MKKHRESGFAMLLVFLMAAVIAISLYMEIPRVAFQAQRQKEQLLIERGEQYKRAIQLFVRTNGRYPGDLTNLENFNNRRFLRHKFIDPMTGKDDWRIVHINNGIFTDSVVNQQKSVDPNQQAASTAGQYVGEQAAIGSTLPSTQQNLNLGLARRRPSEGGAPPAVGPDGQPVGQPLPGQPITGIAPIPGGPAPDQPVPGQASPTQPPGGQFFTQQFPNSQSGQPVPGQVIPGQVAGQPFSGAQPNPNQVQGQPFPGQMPGQPFPGQVQGQPFPGQIPGAQPFPGAQPTPGAPIPPELAGQGGLNSAGQPIPGRLPGFAPLGAPANPNSSASSSQSYVGGNQPYVGGSQPYVGGGQYIGSQPAPTSGMPPSTTFMPGQINPQPAPGQPNFPSGGTPQPFGTPQQSFGTQQQQPFGTQQQPFGTPQPTGAQQSFGTPQTPTPGFPGTGQSPGTDMMNSILRNPRPIQTSTGGTQIGGGIAGVASKSEDAAIMVYNDRTNYNEWEFIFDYTKQTPLMSPASGSIGIPAANLNGAPGIANPGTNPGAAAGPAGVLGTPIGASPAPQGQTSGGQMPGQVPGQNGITPQLPPGIRRGRP